jgi:hypothetical protein
MKRRFRDTINQVWAKYAPLYARFDDEGDHFDSEPFDGMTEEDSRQLAAEIDHRAARAHVMKLVRQSLWRDLARYKGYKYRMDLSEQMMGLDIYIADAPNGGIYEHDFWAIGDDLSTWIEENTEGRVMTVWCSDFQEITFERVEDFALFKLKWMKGNVPCK